MSDQKPEEKEIRGKSYYYAQVDFYMNAGELALALHQANKNIAYNEGDSAAYINRARVYEKLGNFDAAVRDLEEAIRLAPDDVSAYSYLQEISKRAAAK